MDVLVFEVGGVRCALPAPEVREIVRAVTIVPLPKAPPIVEGLINLRGDLWGVAHTSTCTTRIVTSVHPIRHAALVRKPPRMIISSARAPTT
jgi:purine-binding chemotaxis protein CheW